MWDLCRLLWRALVGLFRSRAALEAENLVLRQQVIVLRRTTPRKPVFSSIDRLIFVGLHRLFSNVGEALAIIKPETVVVSENAIRSAIALRARRKTLMPSFPRYIRQAMRPLSLGTHNGQFQISGVSFPKIRSGRIRAVRENQIIIRCDVCDHLPAWNIYRRSFSDLLT
jgi:hypothetical protein